MPEKTTAAVTREDKADLPADQWLEIFSIFIHDLESPLVSMKYLLKMLQEGKLDPDKPLHQRLVTSSRIAIERAESIIYDILAVARAGQVGLPVELINLVPDTLIRETIDLAVGAAEENNISITFTNNSGNTPIKADPKLLKRAMDNLLYNAIRHSPAGGTVAVYTDLGKECLFIHIKDSGPGLGDIEPDELFEKFGQVKLRSQGKHRGVGLGLYFCKLATTGMGGTVMADDHPKGGAVFTLRLKKTEE